ncbi:MAG TPA: maleylpyruvate isomerase N-terminal domain-containing protein [Actinomycetota bacterium]|nr:maleylpyruvate isomerase N-terminal domain-containing protein [Actinomycetota bacterium]
MLSPTARAFLDAARVAADLIAAPEVERAWDGPSALREFTVRGLSGHLLRATTSVEAYLNRREPEGEPVSAAEYYVQAVGEPDVDSELHRAVRQRGEEQAAGGYESVRDEAHRMIDRLEARLDAEPPDRKVEAFKGIVLRLDDYLVTRLIELVVHIDDLAVSVGLPVPALPPEATWPAIDALVETARLKHGDTAVLRALARRERDEVGALRVL